MLSLRVAVMNFSIHSELNKNTKPLNQSEDTKFYVNSVELSQRNRRFVQTTRKTVSNYVFQYKNKFYSTLRNVIFQCKNQLSYCINSYQFRDRTQREIDQKFIRKMYGINQRKKESRMAIKKLNMRFEIYLMEIIK